MMGDFNESANRNTYQRGIDNIGWGNTHKRVEKLIKLAKQNDYYKHPLWSHSKEYIHLMY